MSDSEREFSGLFPANELTIGTDPEGRPVLILSIGDRGLRYDLDAEAIDGIMRSMVRLQKQAPTEPTQ